MEELDETIGNWISDVPYELTGTNYDEAVRSYFVHENTTVYLENGTSVELHQLLGSAKPSVKIYLVDPTVGDCRKIIRFFQAMNPYTADPERIHLNGKKIPITDPLYLILWRLVIAMDSYCGPLKVEDIDIPLRQSCIKIHGVVKPYEIRQNNLQRAKRYDWDQIKKNTRLAPARKYEKYIDEMPADFPRKKWNAADRPRPSNLHWGQLKLLLSEIRFMTTEVLKYDNKGGALPGIVVYAGAAAGYHIPLLSRMFPQILFILYDPAKFGIKPTPNIIIRQEFFTDDIAKLYRGINVVFISDIRLGAEDDKQFEENVHQNNEMMARWVEYIQPSVSSLKFRFPFDHEGDYNYLMGTIHVQQFPPVKSAETRLRVIGSDGRRKNYDVVAYEENMNYFNTEYRNRSFLDKEPVYGINYDTYSLYLIIREYLEKSSLVTAEDYRDDIRVKVTAVVMEIQTVLRGTKLLMFFPWL